MYPISMYSTEAKWLTSRSSPNTFSHSQTPSLSVFPHTSLTIQSTAMLLEERVLMMMIVAL
jgi:hypothetical protein